MRVKLCGLAAIAVLGPLTLGCGSVTPAMPNPITEPVVDHPGSSIVRYRDRVVEVVVETGFASKNIGEEWLILNVGLSGMTGGATEVDRRSVSIRTPGGSTIPLPSYRDFNASFDQLAAIARRATIASQPLGFTRGGRRACAISFMPLPGSGEVANTAVHVTKNDYCSGMLFFPVPGGVQPGRWRLVIDFEETRAVVPFILAVDG